MTCFAWIEFTIVVLLFVVVLRLWFGLVFGLVLGSVQFGLLIACFLGWLWFGCCCFVVSVDVAWLSCLLIVLFYLLF